MVFGGLFCINLAAAKPLEGRTTLIKATLSNLAIHYLSSSRSHLKWQSNLISIKEILCGVEREGEVPHH